MLTKDELESLTLSELGFSRLALQLRLTALELYDKLEQAEAELAELRVNLASILDTYGILPEYAKKLRRLVEGKG